MPILLKFIFLGVFLTLSAFFSGSETAFFSLSRFEIQRMSIKRIRGSRGVVSLLKHPGRLLVGILIGNMVVNIAATTMITGVLLQFLGKGGLPIAMVVMTVLILIFGEITPKVIAVEHNAAWARTGAALLKFVLFVTIPLRLILQGIQAIILGKQREEDMRLGEVDIESALELAHRKGAIGEQSRNLLKHFLALNRITAGDIMIPRAELKFLDPTQEIADAKKLFIKSGIEFALIEQNKCALIAGRHSVLLSESEGFVSEIGIEPAYVPHKRILAGLYDDLRDNESDFLVVIDEHGDIAGALSSERVLSEIFCEPVLKEKEITKEIASVGNYRLIPATMKITRFNELFGSALNSRLYSTVGGYLVEQTGAIPGKGDTVHAGGFAFRVISADPHRVNRIAVKPEGER